MKKIYLSILALAVVLGGGVAIKASAATTDGAGSNWGGGARIGISGMMGRRGGGVFGTVTAVNGNTITISSKGFGANATTTTYTIDATNATVTKGNATSSVSNILVGDSISARGTVSGTSVSATSIRDGLGAGPGNKDRLESLIPQGNGQPVVGGTVSSVSGNIVTITNSSNVTYSIDVTNAKITKSGQASIVSSIVSGDKVIAQGTVNGTSVTAVSLTDQGVITNTATTPDGSNPGAHKGFFRSIGSFFAHIFGF